MISIYSYTSSVLLLLSSLSFSDLHTYRENYSRAVSDKMICEKMIASLEKENNSAINLGYLGAYQTIRAVHVFNPISKLSTFKKGKKNIELAIKREPNNAELRYVRLSVQKNAPSFLGYRSSIKIDKNFILKNREQIRSAIVNKNVDVLLSQLP